MKRTYIIEADDENWGGIEAAIIQWGGKFEIKHNGRPRSTNSNEVYRACVELWFKYYHEKKNTDPTFSGMSGKAIKNIVSKIRTKLSNPNNSEEVIATFAALLNSIDDKWILQNLTISIIDSKFDIIYDRAIHKLRNRTRSTADRWNGSLRQPE